VDHDLKPVRTSSPKPKVTPRPEPKTFAEVPREVYYENCNAAREAGGAPVRSGEPGYGRHLDRDGDGVGCE
ncbi:MAG TPA: excalibur calcium-binding domain-containing protein, partial [Nocardioides sp.]